MKADTQKPFPFDLGSAFFNLCTYLSSTDKLSLSSTCTLLRQVIMRRTIFHSFEVNDNKIQKNWDNYISWLEKYLPIIQPSQLTIILLDQEHEKDDKLIKVLLQPKPFVDALSIRSSSHLLHRALANSCTNAIKLTLHSSDITDELVEFMFKFLTKVSQLEITADTSGFTLTSASNYIQNPLEKLILKPYRLDYQELIKIVRNQRVNRLDQLQIDVEQCEEQELTDIVSQLKHISRLRLYHMERFDHENYAKLLAKHISPEMKELTLTKCYHLDMTAVVTRVACPTLRFLDLTEATKLRDDSVLLLALNCSDLRHLNLSWCHQLTDRSVSEVVKRCPVLERITLNGLKSLTDASFQEYAQLKPYFREKLYDEIKYQFRKECKHSKESDMPIINQKYTKKTELIKLFNECSQLHTRKKTLSNLRYLECNSCNSISDCVLKVIYCFSRTAQVFNYYGEDLSLFRNSFEEEFID